MADEFTQAVQGITDFRGRCETINADCNAFRNAVELETVRLARVVGALPDVAETIATNVQFLRVQLAACKAAAVGARSGLISYEEAAQRVNASLDGANIAVDGLDNAQTALTTQVNGAIEQVRALQEANQDLRAERGVGGVPRRPQAGGRKPLRRRRRRRGGYTPDPCHKRCCGTGTRFSKKRKKCVSRKRGKRRSRRRRR